MTTIGVIGCGYWGPNLVRNFDGLPDARVKTVSDLRPGRIEFIHKNYPNVGTTFDYQGILDDPEIDAVVIVTPAETHYAIASQALAAGKHVMVEKPMARTGDEAWSLVEQAKIAGKVLSAGHVFQFAPGVRRLKREIRVGTVGRVYHVTSTRINLPPTDPRMDVVWDLAPHDCSIVLDLMDQMPVDVVATGQSYLRPGLVDNAHILMTFPDGATAHIHVGWLSSNKMRLLQLFGERGSIQYDEMLALDGKVKLYGAGVDNRRAVSDDDSDTLVYSTGDISVLGLEQHEPLRMECHEFVKAVAGGPIPPNDGVMGARVVELLETISNQIARMPVEMVL